MNLKSTSEEVCRRRGSCRSSRRGGQYHGMYVAKDAVAKLAGTLPQRAVVPCFVRGARLRVCVRVSALRVCVCVAVWEGSVAVRVVCRVLRPLRTPGRPRAGAVTHSAQHAGHTRFTRNFDFGLEVRGERGRRVCRTSCVCVCGLMLSSVYFAYCACCPV